jgi:hypothetical protein
MSSTASDREKREVKIKYVGFYDVIAAVMNISIF